jgi:hypothetical protein
MEFTDVNLSLLQFSPFLVSIRWLIFKIQFYDGNAQAITTIVWNWHACDSRVVQIYSCCSKFNEHCAFDWGSLTFMSALWLICWACCYVWTCPKLRSDVTYQVPLTLYTIWVEVHQLNYNIFMFLPHVVMLTLMCSLLSCVPAWKC